MQRIILFVLLFVSSRASAVIDSPYMYNSSGAQINPATSDLQTTISNTLNSILSQDTAINANTASALNDITSTGSITTACSAGGNSCAATSYVSVASQGQYTVGLSVTGTFVASFLAEGQNEDLSWTLLPMFISQTGVVPYSNVTALSGPVQAVIIGGSYQNIRIRCASYTSGTISVALDASIAQQAVFTAQMGAWTVGRTWTSSNTTDSVTSVPVDGAKATYSAAVLAAATATLAQDIFCIAGSSTKTVKVLKIRITATETTSAVQNIYLVLRSTADTGGTSTSLTRVPHDSNNVASSATVTSYTGNPTLGTTVGNLRTAKMFIGSTSVQGQELIWQFGDLPGQALTLRGTAQEACINFNGVTLSGASFDIDVEWTEE